jgi:ATP-dependent RNA helicase RhlE
VISFTDLGLIEPLLRAIADEGYQAPTPVQEESIPILLAGRDVLACAQTGTGKTAAFALPILQRLVNDPKPREPRGCRALILTPTRELASQIGECINSFGRYLNLRHVVVYGGVRQTLQAQSLLKGVDILVATPGRLLDLMNQGHARLWNVETLVLDEADRMLDMGFIRDVQEILAAVPRKRQAMLCSATMPESIRKLSQTILDDAVEINVAPPATTVDTVKQRVLFVDRADKRALLGRMVHDLAIERALVFTRTKHGASRLAGQLLRESKLSAEAIHSDKTQSAREAALRSFREGKTRILVATDVAARGLDVDGITHVINYEVPNDAENYVHRIGRTARAGASGIAYTLCDADEHGALRDIQKLIGQELTVVEDQPYHSAEVMAGFADSARGGSGRGGGGRGSRGYSGGGSSRGGRGRRSPAN